MHGIQGYILVHLYFRSVHGTNEHNIEMDNPTYDAGDFPDLPDMNPSSLPLSSPQTPTSPRLPVYESVDLVIENHVDADDPNYDVVDNAISELTASLQCQPSQRRFSIQRCFSDGKAVSAYAITAVADEISITADHDDEEEVEIPNNGVVNQEVKKINMLTRPPIQQLHQSSVVNKPVAKSTKSTKKPVCPPKPDISLLPAKYGLKKSSSCPSEAMKYSKLNPLTSYASLEPHLENSEKVSTPSNITKEDYSHLVH